MYQTRICSYYKTSCTRQHTSTSPISFLRLSESLRYRTYQYAGVMNGNLLRIAKRCQLPRESKDRESGRRTAILNSSGSPGAPLYAATRIEEIANDRVMTYSNLGLTSREIRADITQHLCSENEILLCCENCDDLDLLYGMGPHLVTALRHLTIHVDVVSTHDSQCRTSGSCCHVNENGRNYWDHSYTRLASTSNTFKRFIFDRRATAEYLASHPDKSKLGNLALRQRRRCFSGGATCTAS